MKICKQVIEKISIQLMLVTFVLAVLMFAVSPVSAARPAECDLNFCDRDGDGFFKDHKRCALSLCAVAIDCDDSNPDIPEPLACDSDDNPADFTAALVSGAFRFGAVDVTLNKKGNSYSSTKKLAMDRPDDVDSVDQFAWDAVFAECPELFTGIVVGSIMAPNNWSIDNGGPKNAGQVGSNIRIQFRDVSAPIVPEADLDFGLIGVIGPGNELPPASKKTSVITLTEFSFFGAGDPPDGCRSGTLDLDVDSVLVITGK